MSGGSEGFSSPLVAGGGALVYPSIHSPNFVTGSAGWTIRKDGSAEFNNLVIRNGQIISGTDLIYSGVPAAGNLVVSIAAAAGTDVFGNAYLGGLTDYSPVINHGVFTVNLNNGQVSHFIGPISGTGPYVLQATMGIGSGALIGIPAGALLLTDSANGGILLGGLSGKDIAFYPPSGDTTGATDPAKVNVLLAAGHDVRLLPGMYYGNVTVSSTSGQYLTGAGKSSTFWNWVGNGDAFRAVDSSTYSTRTVHGGCIAGITVDGSGATGITNHGIHMGDIRSWYIDVGVRNFAGTNGVGVLFENAFFFTEWLRGRIESENCAQAVVFAVSGAGTPSFDRADLDIYVIQGQASFDGLVFLTAQIVHGRVQQRGNYTTGTSGSPGRTIATSGGTAGIYESEVIFGVECAGAGAVIPITASLGAGTGIRNCTGIMRWLGNGPPAAFAPANPAGGQFLFTGPVIGDPTLGTTDYYGSFGQPNITANGQTFFTNQGSVIRVASGAVFTGLIVQAGQFDGQVCYILNSGAFTLTMAASGTSNVANGTACVVQPASAVMLVWNATLALWFQVRQ